MCPTLVGIHVYRGITSSVVSGESVEAVQQKLSAEVPEPDPADDDLTVWEPDDIGQWGQVSSYNLDDEEWV
jgi:hypothetical protein